MARRLAAGVAAYAGLSAWYRFRPNPPGINGWDASYPVPAEQVRLWHDDTWYEQGRRHSHRQIAARIRALVREAREFVLMDVFLFNLHHTERGKFIPITRLMAETLAAQPCPRYFITDPLNTSYGTARCDPLEWLRAAGVRICLTDLRRLRDNNLLYAPLWRLGLQWFGTAGRGWIPNPLEEGRTTTLRAVLAAANTRGNHRKVIVADDGAGEYRTLVSSANLEDASCYFLNAALEVRSRPVAYHFFEAERALAAMSGCTIPAHIPGPGPEPAGDALVTPLLGAQILRAMLADIASASRGERLYLFTLFLAERRVMRAVRAAAARGVRVCVILDMNKYSFGEPKNGVPNQLTGAELLHGGGVRVRWANTAREEFHTKFMLLRRRRESIIHAGSANCTRRSLSDTNPEANMRVRVGNDTRVARQAWDYVRCLEEPPRSLDFAAGNGLDSATRRWLARFQEATGTATW
ncbi:phospholipase D-like domain-containing protein [Alkalilimnicola sp. S0819]|uniref:phospholipase D-like domain-containing protein n=1 Tax=Alkalilimnicola sp. S0819 TaxID=2613922 RepID=UPI00186A9A6C|nr:phospholipase D-like domain-containing protein [Alkalilimnicola sp. S0819]